MKARCAKMFTVAALILGGFVAPTISVAEEKPNPEFKVFDGYFQGKTSDNSEPVHLMHGSLKPYSLDLGEKFRIWLSFEVKNSPCTERYEALCVMLFEVVDAKGDVWQTWKQELRISNSSDFSVDVPGQVSRKAALGDGTARLRFEFNKKELFSYGVLVTIQ